MLIISVECVRNNSWSKLLTFEGAGRLDSSGQTSQGKICELVTKPWSLPVGPAVQNGHFTLCFWEKKIILDGELLHHQ